MNRNRRSNLKLAGITGAIFAASSWTKPVVNSLMLPAHAQMSLDSAPTILIGSTSIVDPVLVTIEDDYSDFDYSIEILIISDFVSVTNNPPKPNVINGQYVPPLIGDSVTGNSGGATTIVRSFSRRLQSDIEVKVSVTDSKGQTTTQSLRFSTP